jgi:hypothetical protein
MSWIRLSPSEWDITALSKVRQQRIHSTPGTGELIAQTREQARKRHHLAAADWQPADEAPGFFRTKVRIPITRDLFDWIFNGPAGYRAHYYHDAALGELLNRKFVETLIPALHNDRGLLGLLQMYGPAVLQSLDGKWSKIWVGLDDFFQDAPACQLRPQRWMDNNEPDRMGLRAPLPEAPSIELIGTWINPATGEIWLSPDKVVRSQNLHDTGFA